MEQISYWLIDLVANNPRLIPCFLGVWIGSTVVVNFLRGTWPKDDERPRVVNGLLTALDPFAGNFWRMFTRPKGDK